MSIDAKMCIRDDIGDIGIQRLTQQGSTHYLEGKRTQWCFERDPLRPDPGRERQLQSY